jgi:hypothetical protein
MEKQKVRDDEGKDMCSYIGGGRLDRDCTNHAKPEYARLAHIAVFRMHAASRPANHANPEMCVALLMYRYYYQGNT